MSRTSVISSIAVAATCSCAAVLGLGSTAAAAAPAVPRLAVAGDLDGDGYAADDCAPLDPTVSPGAADRPDLDFVDTNCDGIDGDASHAVFVSLAGLDGAPGTQLNPMPSVAAAVTKATEDGKDVYVAGGTYTGTIALADGVGVYGGYAPDWTRSAAETTTLQGAPAAIAVGDTGVVLQLLTLHGQQDGSGNSYGLRAAPEGEVASQVLLEAVQVTADDAANGSTGFTGGAGVPGAGRSGGSGGDGGCGSGAPGQPGTGNGGPGTTGLAGTNGTNVVLSGPGWVRYFAGFGGQGGSGGGGVGGTGGAGASFASALCGGRGGNGGSGGGGGSGGSGGLAGGGSFGAYVFGSSLVAVDSALKSGKGGNGGMGGSGGSGGAPAGGLAGAAGQCQTIILVGTVCASNGLPGGPGLQGGTGGRGGGGAGGPSAPVYQGGAGSGFVSRGSTLDPGSGGTGGLGGVGSGATGASGPVLRTGDAPTVSTYDFDADGVPDETDGCPADPAPSGCPEPPETRITSGPADGGYLLSRAAAFRLASTSGSSYTCSLDNGDGVACTSPYRVGGLTSVTHLLRAWSRQSPTNADPTPATRTFTVPRNNTQLQHSRGWEKVKDKGYFLNTYSSTFSPGASLTAQGKRITGVALVATTGPGFGTVKVMLGTELLKKVSLDSAETHKKQLIPVTSFGSPRTGAVKVVVISKNKTVRIEGLGLSTG